MKARFKKDIQTTRKDRHASSTFTFAFMFTDVQLPIGEHWHTRIHGYCVQFSNINTVCTLFSGKGFIVILFFKSCL